MRNEPDLLASRIEMLIILDEPEECTLCFAEIEAGHTALTTTDRELLCRRCGYDLATHGWTELPVPRRPRRTILEEHHRKP